MQDNVKPALDELVSAGRLHRWENLYGLPGSPHRFSFDQICSIVTLPDGGREGSGAPSCPNKEGKRAVGGLVGDCCEPSPHTLASGGSRLKK